MLTVADKKGETFFYFRVMDTFQIKSVALPIRIYFLYMKCSRFQSNFSFLSGKNLRKLFFLCRFQSQKCSIRLLTLDVVSRQENFFLSRNSSLDVKYTQNYLQDYSHKVFAVKVGEKCSVKSIQVFVFFLQNRKYILTSEISSSLILI